MSNVYPILYEVVPKESFEAEDRVFLKGERYPVFNKNGRSLLCAENGEFYFTNELMQKVIIEWDLDVVKVNP